MARDSGIPRAIGPPPYGDRVLEDGTYDAIVVDADVGPEPGSLTLELAIAAGAHKGEVIPLTVRD